MSVQSENRWKAKSRREAEVDERRRHDAEMLTAVREPRVEVPAPSPPPSRSLVRRWLGRNAALYDGATELAEGANAALDLPQSWLDDETHWIWDDALTAWERAS